MDTVNEGTTAYLSVQFLDKAGSAAAPSSVSYRIDCLTTGTAVLAPTSATPGSTVELTITATQNAILGGRPFERRRVTVEAGYGAGDGVKSQFDYLVRNLSAVS
jgi:hypothetical protein